MLTWTATLLGILLLTTCAQTTNLASLGHRLCALAGPSAPFVLHHRPGTQKSMTFADQKQMLDLNAKHQPQISSAVDTCCERNHLMNCVCSPPSRRYDQKRICPTSSFESSSVWSSTAFERGCSIISGKQYRPWTALPWRKII